MSVATDPGRAGSTGDQFYTINEVAALMRVSKMTVYRLVHSGVIAAFHIGRSYRIASADLTEYLTNAQLDPTNALGPSSTDPERAESVAESDAVR